MAGYKEAQQRSRLIWLTIGFIITIAALASGLWIYLQYLVYQQVYSVKAGLDWFSIVFYHNYTFVAAALFSLLLINPQIGHSDLWSLEAALGPRYNYRVDTDSYEPKVGQNWPRRLSDRSWAVWQFFKWMVCFIFFVVFGGPPFVGNVMNSVMMMVMGFGSWYSVPRVFILPLFPASGNDLINLMPTMEVQYRLLLAGVQFILIIFAIRILFRVLTNIFSAYVEHQSLTQRLGALLLVAAVIPFSVILGAPYWLMDVRTPFIYGSAWAVFILFVLIWMYSRT